MPCELLDLERGRAHDHGGIRVGFGQVFGVDCGQAERKFIGRCVGSLVALVLESFVIVNIDQLGTSHSTNLRARKLTKMTCPSEFKTTSLNYTTQQSLSISSPRPNLPHTQPATTHPPIPLQPIDQIIRSSMPNTLILALRYRPALVLGYHAIRDQPFRNRFRRIHGEFGGVGRACGCRGRGLGGLTTSSVERGRSASGIYVERFVSRKLEQFGRNRISSSSVPTTFEHDENDTHCSA